MKEEIQRAAPSSVAIILLTVIHFFLAIVRSHPHKETGSVNRRQTLDLLFM
jgi:hypothetical protein